MKYKDMFLYDEPCEKSERYRENYYNSLHQYLEDIVKDGEKNREALMGNISFNNIASYRSEYIKKLGKPLSDYSFSIPKASKEFVVEDDLCHIYRITFHLEIGIEFYGILCLPKHQKKSPLVIMQHGGGGTPELCMDFHGKNNYDNITKILLEKGVVVFSPQLLLWSFSDNAVTGPNYQLEYERGTLDLLLKQHGSGIVTIEIYCIKKAIDYFSNFEEVEIEHLGMMGLSYGGLYTLHTMAAEERIKAGYSCAAFNNRVSAKRIVDYLFPDFGNSFFDAEIGVLCMPRMLFIDVGKEDSVFDYKTAVEEAERLNKYAKKLGCEDKVSFHLWEGGHKIDIEGKNLKKFMNQILSLFQRSKGNVSH